MASFMVRSTSGLVSLLNLYDVEPYQEAPACPSAKREGLTNEVKQPPVKRRHPCSKCSKSFTTSGHLTRHLKIHAGVRDLSCPFSGCDKRCGRQDNLIQHFRIHLPKADRKQTYHFVRSAMENIGSPEEDVGRELEIADAEVGPQMALQRTPSPSSSVESLIINRMVFLHSTIAVSNPSQVVNQAVGSPLLPPSAEVDSSPSLTYSSSPGSLPSSPQYLYSASRSYENTGDYRRFKISYARGE